MDGADDLKIDIATADDEKELKELLISSFRAPIGVSINVTNDDMASFLPNVIKTALSSPLSLVARNAEGKIIAVQLVTVHRRNDEEERSLQHEGALTEKAAKIVKFLTHVEGDLWNLVPSDVNCLMRFAVTFVLPQYQRHGIARRLSSMRLDVAKQLGCQGITTTSVSIKSQNLRISEGYEVIKEVKYKDWLDENGKVIFVINDGSDKSIVTFKRL